MFSLLCRIRDFLRDFRSRCRKLLHRACLLGRTLRQRLCPAGHLIGACVDLAGCCAHLRHGFFHRIGDAVQRLLDLYKVAAIKRRGLGGEIFVRDFTQYIGNIRNDPFQTGLRMRKDLFQIADLVVGLAFDVRTQIALGKFLSHLTDQSQGSDQARVRNRQISEVMTMHSRNPIARMTKIIVICRMYSLPVIQARTVQ